MPDRNNRTNAIETPTLFDDALKTSQSASQFGPQSIYRVQETPPDSFGRNGDIAIVDNTAFTDTELASGKEPTAVGLCQKVPAMVPDGPNMATSTINGAVLTPGDQFSIDKLTLGSPTIITLPAGNVFVKQVADAINISTTEGISAEWQNTSTEGSVASPFAFPGNSITINGTLVTFTGGYLDHIVGKIRQANIPFIHADKKDNHLYLTHVDGGTVTVGGINAATIFGVGTVTGGLLTINNEDGLQVDLANVTGAPLTTIGFPLTIAAAPMVLGGTWTCFGSSNIQVLDNSTPVGSFDIFNFLGPGITSITNAGGGQVDINISGGGGVGGPAYGSFAGDIGTSIATTPTELITFGGIGVKVTASDAGAGLDTIDFDMDIPDLPLFGGVVNPLVDQVAVEVGGVTYRTPASDLRISPGLTLTVINGQTFLTLVDITRGKTLTITEHVLVWNENQLSNLDWIRIGNANDADTGYIMDFDGTLVYATGHCENTAAASKDIRLFIDGVDNGVLGTLSGGANASFVNNTINIDFTQGQRLRLRAQNGIAGTIQDTVVKLTVKWRG